MKKIITFILALCIMNMPLNIRAAEVENNFVEYPNHYFELKNEDETVLYASPELAACDLGVGIASNGVSVTYITRATQTADEIGVKNLVLQEKTTFGWTDITIGNRCGYNRDYYGGSLVYTAAVRGKTYRVCATHYAVFGGVEKTFYSTSPEITFN